MAFEHTFVNMSYLSWYLRAIIYNVYFEFHLEKHYFTFSGSFSIYIWHKLCPSSYTHQMVYEHLNRWSKKEIRSCRDSSCFLVCLQRRHQEFQPRIANCKPVQTFAWTVNCRIAGDVIATAEPMKRSVLHDVILGALLPLGKRLTSLRLRKILIMGLCNRNWPKAN